MDPVPKYRIEISQPMAIEQSESVYFIYNVKYKYNYQNVGVVVREEKQWKYNMFMY